ncbi:hypothetical protein FRC04_011082 [Tulasnella sp. 424]|nr:hypothetical protein FRC04_011082 [Tulasnella sp. 424]KAG8978399.1 hypothetical protein FRC05_010644 [Tulasnella sp. 425]
MDEDCNKKRLFHRSNIGFGFVSDGEDGPRYTDRPVIADVPLDRIAVVHKAECGQEIQTTYSGRGSNYLSAGWADAELAAKTPWADAQASHGKSDNGNHIYVTGQYNFTYRKIFLKDSVSELRPHPEFRQAIANALAVQNDLQRSQEVRRVLNRYGTMFPTAVEMGGKKYSTIKVGLDGSTTESSVRREMSLTLGKSFGAAEAGANLGAGAEEISFGWIPFYTVSLGSFLYKGGAIEAATFTKWRESLESHHQWATIKVLEVESVLSLFDKETQSKIALAVATKVVDPPVPKIPLYQFRNEAGRHYLGTDPDASKIPVTGDGPWTNQGALGLVFKSPVDDAVPLYHLTSGQQHLYTTSDVEKRSQSNYSDRGIVCYILTREKPGTIVINRMVNSSWGDNVHAKANEIDEQKRWGYRDEGVRWYVYPS